MICILAPSERKARAWAENQGLYSDEWFHVSSPEELRGKENFHTIVIGEFAEHQLALFERTYHVAKNLGAKNRK